jgi:hypothetical protein
VDMKMKAVLFHHHFIPNKLLASDQGDASPNVGHNKILIMCGISGPGLQLSRIRHRRLNDGEVLEARCVVTLSYDSVMSDGKRWPSCCKRLTRSCSR